MVRNLLAAEPSPDAELDPLMDSATPEAARGVPARVSIGCSAIGPRSPIV